MSEISHAFEKAGFTDKNKVMEEAADRAIKARNSLNKEKIDSQNEEKAVNIST